MIKMIAISDMRKRFGEVEKLLPTVDHIIITKKGKPFASLQVVPGIKKDMMRRTAGAFRGTSLDDDSVWKEVQKKSSRKKAVTL